jgi:hypothetical protein
MMTPKPWGPCMWKTLHYIALGYPDNPSVIDQTNYAEFFMSLYKVIPCITCAKHYQDMVQQNSVVSHLQDNKSLFRWTVDIHNLVNQRLGKKTWTVDEAFKHYTSTSASSPLKETFSENNTNTDTGTPKKSYSKLLMILLVIAAFLIFALIFKSS